MTKISLLRVLFPMSSLQGDDEEENVPEEGEDSRMFSRRKLQSNWDRYQDSEKVECDDDTPTVRGTDFDVLLAAAGKILLSPAALGDTSVWFPLQI